MDGLEMLGYSSIIILNMGWWIQVYHVLRTKHARDISLLFLVTTITCFIGLQAYTWFIYNPVYLVGNGIGIAGVSVLLALKIKYGKNGNGKHTDAERDQPR
ncbi:MAG: hypothetical protein QCI38_08150 [Candidatus Thermoplasmatota archaeon]|nr:hypothetical protein [Candidatus Thermoplasmatota archaeon]